MRLSTYAAICCVLLTLMATDGDAQAPPFCAPASPTPTDGPQRDNSPRCGQPRCDTCTASPCFAKTGVYTTSETDLQIPTNGFPLVASRSYESSQVSDGPVGYGWRSNFGARLYLATYLIAAPSTVLREAVIVMPDGEAYRFRENGNQFTPPAGRRDTLVRLGDGSYLLTLERSNVRYAFDSNGFLVTIRDEYDNTLRFTPDANGRVSRVDDDSGTGRHLIVTWNPAGRISSILDNAGRTVVYSYATNGTLTGVTNPQSQITSYTYEQRRFAPLLTHVHDHWNRLVTNVVWDSFDRVQSYTEAGEQYSLQYLPAQPPLLPTPRTIKTHSKGTQTIHYDADGLVTSRGAEQMSYDANGDLELRTDARGVKTRYTYLSDGRIATVTHGEGGTPGAGDVSFHYFYDTTYPNRIARIEPHTTNQAGTPFNGHWLGWKYTYYTAADNQSGALPGALRRIDRLAYQHLTSTVLTPDNDPVSRYAEFSYDAKGRITRSWNRSDAETLYAYDDTARTMTVTLPANNHGFRTTIYAYDTLGRTTSVTDPNGQVTSYEYDSLDRVENVTPPKPSAVSALSFVTSFAYDNSGDDTALRYTHATDLNGRITKQGYDQFGRLVESVDAAGAKTLYGYANGLLSSITDANGNVTSYVYDANRRLQKTTFPGGAFETYLYYGDGLMQSKTDRKSVTTTYTYDLYGRLFTQTTAGKSITFNHTGEKLTSVSDTHPAISELTVFTHEPKTFLVETETQGQAGGGMRGKIAYTYYPAADWVHTYKVTDGGSNRTPPANTYLYWPDGSVRRIDWDHVPTAGFFFNYDKNGRQTSITFPNAQTRTMEYDDQGRLTSIANRWNSTTLASFVYEYDKDNDTGQFTVLGQRTKATAVVPSIASNPSTTEYFYDANYQLTRTRTGGTTERSWTYDSIGNRTAILSGGSTINYTYVQNASNKNTPRLLTASTSSVGHDANGNVLNLGFISYTWDVLDRLASRNTGAVDNFTYDFQNRRTAADHQSTRYIYRGLDPVTISYTKNNGYYMADYLFGPGIDTPLSRVDSQGATYYSVDGLGSVILITDATGAVKNKYAYTPWGETVTASGPVVQPFGYTGREFAVMDSVTAESQYYYRARYLDPGTGRFLSEDPIRLYGYLDEGAYSYVVNNPIIYGDPMGLFSESQIDRSCDNWGCRQQFLSETQQECDGGTPYITDARLRRCVQRRCSAGGVSRQRFHCTANCVGNNAAMETHYGSGSTAICTSRLPSNPRNAGPSWFGQAAIHEMAHGCNWYHGRNWRNGRGPGDGVPLDPGPDPPGNPYGRPPRRLRSW